MCDYSLHLVASRPAKVGEKLVSTRFPNTSTRGFASVGERNVAVCLLPGTELDSISSFSVPGSMGTAFAVASIIGGADGSASGTVTLIGNLQAK
jgi:hypothetical protein